jgi:hypothetical protein
MNDFNNIYIVAIPHRGNPELLTFSNDEEIIYYCIENFADFDGENAADALSYIIADFRKSYIIRNFEDLKRAAGDTSLFEVQKIFQKIADNEGAEI